MQKEDYTIYEYRMEKEKKNCEFVLKEKLTGKFKKHSIYTKDAGYVDISIYSPSNCNDTKSIPTVFSFHGGGFVLGFYELDGKYCQKLADYSNCNVINVDYCLAPEFKFPIPIYSSYEVIVNMKKDSYKYGIDGSRIMVMGHSAGGNIAAALCLLDKERQEIGLVGQIINYAPLRQSLSEEFRNVAEPDKAISRNRMVQYIQWYFDKCEDMDNILASPLLGELDNLPRMLIISAELDSLAEEEFEFAEKARLQGVDVQYKKYENCQHGFTHEELKEFNKDAANDAWHLMSKFIISCFHERG